MFLKIKKMTENAITPTRNHKTDAGLDMYANTDVIIPSHMCSVVSTGIAAEIPEGFAGLIWGRSGLSKCGIHKYAGVVDSSYRGEIKVVLYNSTHSDYIINRGDRIAQLLIQKVEIPIVVDVEALNETERGADGFGSSGK